MKLKKLLSGQIESVRPPNFSSAQLVYIVNVKVDGKWQYVWRRRESDSNDVYNQFIDRKREQEANAIRQTTHLTNEQLKDCERAIYRIQQHYGCTEYGNSSIITEAVELFTKRVPTLNAPFVSECIEKFLIYKRVHVVDITLRDYIYCLKPFRKLFGDKRITEITSTMMKDYLDEYSVGARRGYTIYLKTFFNYCCGADNTETNEGYAWILKNPINWRLPKQKWNSPDVLEFEDILKVIKLSTDCPKETNGLTRNHQFFYRDTHELIAYYIFRIFSMMRRQEFIRIIEYGGMDITKNKYFDLEKKHIVLTPDIYQKRRSLENFKYGRIIKPIHSTFLKWLEWIAENNIRLRYPRSKLEEFELRLVCKRKGIKGVNILRHTGITYHLLKFNQSTVTANSAGTSLKMIETHYLSKTITMDNAINFYNFTPDKAKELGLIHS